MVEANAREYLLKNKKTAAWLCGDREKKNCGLGGELADLGCNSCFYKAGQFGRDTIGDHVEIHYNPNWPNRDFVKKE